MRWLNLQEIINAKNKNSMKSKNNMLYIIFISAVSALGGILFGYDTGVVSGTITPVSIKFDLDTVQQGWYVSCALLGAIIGVAIAGVMSDFFGRKRTLLISAVLFTVLGIGCAIAGSFAELVGYRIIGGIAIGIVSIVSPLYISEMSIPRYRGRLVSLYQLAITVGFLASYIVNYFLLNFGQSHIFESALMHKIFNEETWRAMLGMEAVPAILFLGVLFYIPESPRGLVLRTKEQRALNILRRIYREKDDVRIELNNIKSVVTNKEKSEWKFLLKPGILKVLLIGLSIAILGQFMGVNAVMYYGPSIFQDSGLAEGDSLFYQVLVGLVNVLTTVLALLIIDKVGRKKLVYYGVSSIFISLLAISFYFRYSQVLGIPPVVMLILFLLYAFSCAISISAVIWVLLSELFPLKVRGVAMSIAGFSLWVGSFLVGQLTPWMLENLTPSGTFILFAMMCLPYMLIVWKLVPETMGKSLEEIETNWN